METPTLSYSNKVKSLGRFFAQTEKGAYTFAVADDELLQQNINQNLLQLAANQNSKLAIVNIKQLATKDKAPIAALRHYLKEQKDIDGLIITNLYGLLISKEYPDFLTQLNFVREALIKLNLPILFWINHEMIPLLSRQAKDLYAQRHNFNLYFTETANRNNELQADQYIAIERSKAVPNKQQHESRLKLLFKQLEKAEIEGEDKADIANDIVIEILGIYSKLPQMSEALVRLFEEYEPYFDKKDPKTSFSIAYGLQQAKKLNKAEQFYKAALSYGRKLAETNPQSFLPDIASTLNNLGALQKDKNEFDKAEQAYKEALSTYRKLVEANPQSYLPDLAMTLNNLGLLQNVKNEFDKAEKSYFEALEIKRKLADVNPQSYLLDVATTLNNLGTLQHDKNEFDKAEQAYVEALSIYRKLAKANPQNYLPDVAMTLNNLGALKRNKNEFDKAEKSYFEALKIGRKLAEVNPQSCLPDVASTLNNLGLLQNNKNEFDKAEKSYLEALEIYRKLAEVNPQSNLSNVAMTLNNLGALKRNKNEFDKAEKSYLEALKIGRKLAELNPSAFEINLADTFMSLCLFFRFDKPNPNQSLQHAKAAAALYTKYAATVPHAKKYLQIAQANIKHWQQQNKS